MTATDILAWQGFFGIVAQIGATLTGLLFVGLTISLGSVLQAKGYLYRGFAALYLQFETVVLGLCGILPGQSGTALGAEFIFIGLAVLTGIRIFGRSFPEDENSYVLGSKGPRLVREVLLYTATLAPVISGISLIAHLPGALYWILPAEIACLYLSIANSWVFAIEIPRRMEEDRKAGDPL